MLLPAHGTLNQLGVAAAKGAHPRGNTLAQAAGTRKETPKNTEEKKRQFLSSATAKEYDQGSACSLNDHTRVLSLVNVDQETYKGVTSENTVTQPTVTQRPLTGTPPIGGWMSRRHGIRLTTEAKRARRQDNSLPQHNTGLACLVDRASTTFCNPPPPPPHLKSYIRTRVPPPAHTHLGVRLDVCPHRAKCRGGRLLLLLPPPLDLAAVAAVVLVRLDEHAGGCGANSRSFCRA